MARRPVGKPLSANWPWSSVTTTFRASGTAIITPAMGRPLNEEMAVPQIPAVVSAWKWGDEARSAAMTSSMIYYTTPSYAFPRLYTPLTFIAHISPTRCLPPHRVTHDQREVA